MGDLQGYIQKQRENGFPNHSLKGKHILTWIHQIADGMDYLKEHNVVHRDLAARNILLRNMENVLVTDFGLSKVARNTRSESLAGTSDDREEGPLMLQVQGDHQERVAWKWVAPEAMHTLNYTDKTDVWAYGITIWEILKIATD